MKRSEEQELTLSPASAATAATVFIPPADMSAWGGTAGKRVSVWLSPSGRHPAAGAR